MKLALYLPNFRDKITVSEIVDLARLAEELEFDSLWTLDRIVVPEASDHQALRKPFGFMKEFPHGLPVISRGEFLQGPSLIPYLAAITKKIRVGVSVIDTPIAPRASCRRKSPPGITFRAEGSTWASVPAGCPRSSRPPAPRTSIPAKQTRDRDDEIMQASGHQDLFEYHGEFASFPKCGFGVKPVQKPHPPIYFGGLGVPKIAAKRVAKYGLAGWNGIQDTPDEIMRWRAAIKEESEASGSPHSVEDLEIASMLFFDITSTKTDQTPNGKLTPSMTGTPAQLVDNLKRYRDAGLTLPLLWPPFRGVPPPRPWSI